MSLRLPLLIAAFIAACFCARGQEESVSITTEVGQLYGSLLIPAQSQKPVVVLIISGSGPTDRDGNQQALKNNSLKMLADSLYSHGIASLRYDKRGIAASEIKGLDQHTLRFEHYVADAKAWVQLLQSDKRFSKVVIAGHSEGALIGMLAAIGNPAVKGYISVAGAARPADEMIKEQMAGQPKEIREMVFPRLDTLRGGDTLHGVPEFLYALFNPGVQPYLISWMKYNPVQEIKKLSLPVLIIQGSTDIQVLPKDADMLKVAYAAASLKMITGMNHVLKEFPIADKRAQVPTYSNPSLPLHAGIVAAIVPFIKNLPDR